jgi:hypothetical protein
LIFIDGTGGRATDRTLDLPCEGNALPCLAFGSTEKS